MKDLFDDRPFQPRPTKPDPTAAAARDQAIARVTSKADPKWRELLHEFVQRLPRGWEGTAEDIRVLATAVIGRPHHHNAWGGAIMGVVRRGLLADTGRASKMKTAKSHARKTTLWRRT